MYDEEESFIVKEEVTSTLVEESQDYMSHLTPKQRFIGFLITAGIGTIYVFVSSIAFPALNPIGFTILYILGIILLLLSTCFLVSFTKQLKEFYNCNNHRILAVIYFFTCFIATLVISFALQLGVVILVLGIFQMIVFMLYTVSYIPFARMALIKFLFDRDIE